MKAKHFLNGLIGKTGLINHSFTFGKPRNFMPSELYLARAEGNNLEFLKFTDNNILAGSTSLSYEHAVYSAIGEYIERLSSCYLDYDKMIIGSYNHLQRQGYNLMHPNTISLFAKWQYEQEGFAVRKFGEDDKVHWIKGFDYLKTQEIYVPAFLTYVPLIKDEEVFTIPTSTGHAAGATIIDSIQSGFLEISERHAWCNLWYNQNKKKFITYDSKTIIEHYLDDEIGVLFDNNRVKIKVFDLGEESFAENIVVFILFNYKNISFYSIGAASKFNKKDAIVKACLEAYQGVNMAISLYENCNWGNDYKEILPGLNSYEDIFNFYNRFPEVRKKCPFFIEALKDEPTLRYIKTFDNKVTSMEKDAIQNIARIENLYYVDLTMNELDLPYHVTKTIVPNLALMSPSFQYPFLGSSVFDDKANLFLELPHCFP